MTKVSGLNTLFVLYPGSGLRSSDSNTVNVSDRYQECVHRATRYLLLIGHWPDTLSSDWLLVTPTRTSQSLDTPGVRSTEPSLTI